MQPKIVRIDGQIGQGLGEVSKQSVIEQLPVNGTDPIVVKIHSEGGNVFEGFAIHDVLAAYQGPKTLSIESSAFSIASFIAMAFDDVSITPNGYMMLHNPYMGIEGDDDDLAKGSEMIGQLKATMIDAYAKRSGKSAEEIREILKRETYLNAQQAIAMGFASRIAGEPVVGRAFAKLSEMPHGVVAALFGAGSGGNREPLSKGKPMSDSQPVAATLQEIKAAFPKASSDFVVKCLERSLPMASVASAAVEEMMAENTDLKAKLAAMEEELAKAKAQMPGTVEVEEEEVDELLAMEGGDEKEEMAAKAKASGVKPIAKAKAGGGASASARWNAAIDSYLAKCNGNKARAVAMANRLNPGLRQAFVDEANAAR